MIFLFHIILITLKFASCQWIHLGSHLISIQAFQDSDINRFVTKDGDAFKSSQYINCNKEGSYIVLNTSQIEVQNNLVFNWNYQMYFVTFDLIFYGEWNSQDYVNYSFGSQTFSLYYNSTQIPREFSKFCETQTALYQTFNVNVTVNTNSVSGYHVFKVQTNTGSVAIKNLLISGLKCSPNCGTCFGGNSNQCLTCFNVSNNIPDCKLECLALKPFLVNRQGCFEWCQIEQAQYFRGSCVAYPITVFVDLDIVNYTSTQQYRWQRIFDEKNLNSQIQNNIAFEGYFIYGIFNQNQGYQSVVNLIGNYGYYLIGIKIEIILFNPMPIGSSISLLINNTYQANIYKDESGQKFDKFVIQYQNGKRRDLTYGNVDYNDNYYYTLYMYTNVTRQFIIKLIGNYPSSSDAGWAIRRIQITSGQCSKYCLKCESQFQCSQCYQKYFISKSGTCSTCQNIYQKKINATHCLELDDITPFSEYLVKEFIDLSINPETYQQYKLMSKNGTNFLKGEEIFYSIWQQKYRIFGGPQIWAQAKFQRIYEITRPHYSVSIVFKIIFGPSFPKTGQFIFYLDQQAYLEITIVGKEVGVEFEYLHNQTTLSMEWECKGPDNEPIQAYCGFYQFYVAVHYCQPSCNGQCTNSTSCLQAVTTITCSDGQYLDLYTNSCQQCTSRCKKCTSLQNCQECIDGYTYPSLGCICGTNQFEENNQCKDCSQDCNQCINSQFCLECKAGVNKVLINNQCTCQEGYYNDSSLCMQCKEKCKKCTNNSDCSECFEGYNLEEHNTVCQLNPQYYYSPHLQKLLNCPTDNSDCNPCQLNISNCKCGDSIIYNNEDCDDGNQIENDGCSNDCKFKCEQFCTKCINGKCFECATWGYYLDTQTQTCKEQCYDGIVVGKEECDDAKDNSNCKDCKFFCRPDCQQCDYNNGTCKTCREGLKAEKNYCKNVCGDGIVVSAPDIKDYEECDDQNPEEFDGCHECKFQCQKDSLCAVCQNNKCKYCQYGYFLNQMMNKCDCGQSCDACDFSEGLGCKICQKGYELRNKICYPICGDSYITIDEQCDDGNMNIEDGCHQCMYICEQTCTICIYGDCLICNVNYSLQNGRCIPIIINHPQLDESEKNIIPPDLFYEECLNFYFIEQFYDYGQMDISKINCQYIIIDFQKYKQQENQIEEYEYTCPINCSSCFHGLCTLCAQGYNLDLIDNICNSVCGDQYITIEELCDDGNNIIQDGCYQCRHQCQDECTNCYYGKCKACIQSYYFDLKKERCVERTICIESQGYYYDDKQNICYSQCGDNIKAGKEQCEDGNNNPYDGCYQCQYQCEQLCSICQQGICVNCQIGYQISTQNSTCVNNCGDGLIVGIEQCDDANSIVRDGCTNCQIDPGYKCITLSNKSYCFTCKSNCAQCDYNNNQINCISCLKGYFLTNNECIKCSDYCEECQNHPNICTKCKIENCQKCDNQQGFYSDFNLKKCFTKCGDSIIAGKEQCDDGNTIDNDGCNFLCQIEKGFACQNNQCQKNEKKNIEYDYSNSTTTNSVLLKSELDFKVICPKITISIELFQTHEFNFTSTSQQINQTLYGCEIIFQFFKTITEINLIHLIIPLDTDGSRLLEEYRITIIPRKQIYYHQDQKQLAENIASTSNQFQFLLQLIGPFTIILGGINFFWTILEILTWINNFYFLNIEYPINVKIFFQKFKWDDIFSIPDIITFNTPNDPYYFQAPIKFQEKDVNPLFINNIQLFICLIVIAILLYFISSIIIRFYKIKLNVQQQSSHKIYIFTQCHISRENQQSTQNKQGKTLYQKIQEIPLLPFLIFRTALEYQFNFWSKIHSIINLLLLDLFMACLLQLSCPKINYHYIIMLNNILAVCFLLITFAIYNIYIYVSSKHKMLLNHLLFKKNYLSIYEVLNQNNKIAMQYCYFNLLRKFFFISFIVFLYEKPMIQTTFCCLSCFMNLAFLFYQNPFNSKSALIQSGIPEICIFLIVSLAVLIAFDDMNNILTVNSKYSVGWIIIILILISIAIQLIFLLIEFFERLKSNLRALKYFIFPQKNKQP